MNARDQRIADETHTDRTLLCAASGCPNRWSVDAGEGRMCSAHAWVDRSVWPQVTQEQQDAETDRAYRRSLQAPPAKRPMSKADKLAILAKLREQVSAMLTGRGNGKVWAYALRDREQRGERLTPAQRAMWRAAIEPATRTISDEERAA